MAELLEMYLAPKAGAPMERMNLAEAVAGRGLKGDRYYEAIGSFSRWPGPHRDVTLIAEEDLNELKELYGIALLPEQSRRNILTRGVDLKSLVKKDFQIGEVQFRALRRCQPCKYLARLVEEPDLVKAMIHRGGVRAQIITDGQLSAGDKLLY